ncbi:glycosyltransferase family 39 protein [Candidatus Berkelbacteria bacterium]|nr:glycosyltransferase family 39 protein [Candidatus Berkelbacteria bacterium]
MSLYFALIIAAIVRFWGIATRPFDGDEGVILWQVSQPTLRESYAAITRDAHPPFLHLLSWFGIHIFGRSELGMRFFPALFGVGLVFASYRLALLFLGRRAASLAAWLVALSPYLVFFSREARMYAPLAFLCVVALTKLVEKKWWQFTLFATAAVYTHYLGLLLIVLALFRRFWKGAAASVILLLPLLPLAIPQFIGRLHEAGGTHVAANIKGFINVFYRFGAGRTFLGLEFTPHSYLVWFQHNPLSLLGFVVTLVVPATLVMIGTIKTIRDRKWRMIWQFIGLSLTLALVSTEVGSRAARNLSFLAPLYLIVLTVGIAQFKKPYHYVVSAAACAIFVLGIGNQLLIEDKKPGVPVVVNAIHAAAANHAVVLARGSFLHGESTIFDYYWRRDFHAEAPPDVVDYFADYHIGNINELKAQSVAAKISELQKTYDTVFYYDFSYSPNDLAQPPTILGLDKENQPIALWRIER